MTYASSEESRHSGQPVELYHFHSAYQPIVGANDTLVASDGFEYANQAAMEAPGWALLDEMTSPAGAITVGATDQVHQGTYSLKMSTTGTGGISGSERLRVTRTFSGLTPSALHKVTVRARQDAWSHFDNHSRLWVNGVSGDGAAIQGANRWFQLLQTGTTNGSGDLTVFLQRVHAFVTETRNVWWDRLQIWLPGDPGSLPTTDYFYTSDGLAHVFRGDTYVPAIFARSDLDIGSTETAGGEVEITMPRDHAVALLVRDGLPIQPITCTIYRVHRPDIAAGTSYITPFVGQVSRARFRGPACILTVASPRGLLDRKRPHVLCQRQCAWMLYDARCQLEREDHRFDSVVAAIDESTVTVTGLATESGDDATKFELGVLVGPSGEQITVESQSGDVVTLMRPPQSLAVSDAVTLYWGCDRLPATCENRFDNLVNIGATPLQPQRDPFGQTGMVV